MLGLSSCAIQRIVSAGWAGVGDGEGLGDGDGDGDGLGDGDGDGLGDGDGDGDGDGAGAGCAQAATRLLTIITAKTSANTNFLFKFSSFKNLALTDSAL